MAVWDYLSLFYSTKGWLKIAERRGKDETLVIHAVFSYVILLIIILLVNIVLGDALPSILASPNLWGFPIVAAIINTWAMKTYLEKNLGSEADDQQK